MPKAGNSKKRKRESKKDEDHDAKKAKSKENDRPYEDQQKDCTNVSNLPYEEQQEVDDIDEKLEQNAAKNNLTTINVRSILHHVVSDKRVLAMVKSVAAELQDEQDDAATSSNVENVDLELDFAPKMTRAKSKQTNQGDPIAVLASQSPIKELRTKRPSTKKKIHFTELELPDSSSDEEYNPDNEEDGSDEDTESCVSFTSDLASPQVPGTPEREKTGDTKASEENTEKTVTRSSSKKLSQEPFKVPYPVASTAATPVEEVISTKQKTVIRQAKKTSALMDSLRPALVATFSKITVVEEGDLIAKRTRSQLPLQDVPIESIEATFQPPDFTADMYDTIQEEDLDFEDIEWQKWLQGLINSDDVCGDEDHEDSEYNFMAEEQREEKEEYRNDRAVRIPKKEVNQLLDELLKDYDDSEDTLWLDEESEDVGYLEMLNVRDAVDKKVQFFAAQQLERLTEQLQQHAQLLTQIFLMAREDDSLSKEAQLAQDYVNELKGFHERASNAQLIRGLGDGKVHASAFSFPGLERAVEIVNSTFVPKRRTSSPRKCTTPKKDNKSPSKTGRRSKTQTEDLLPPLSETNIQLMATKKSVFRFVELLPHHSLLPRTGDTPKQLNGLRVKFTDAEDNLLALGMKQLGKKWDLIQEHLLPIKSPKQLQIRCKNLLSARAPENIVKYYRRNKELWHLPTTIQVYVESNGRRVRVRDSLEPEWLVNYKKKQKERRDSQQKSRAIVVQQSIESLSYGRPIVPKLSGGAYTVALPSGSSPSDRGQVTWVTITSSASPWKALTPAKVVEDVCEQDNALIVASVRSSPSVSVGQDTGNQTGEERAPLPSPAPASSTEADVDAIMNPSPANDESVVPTHQMTEKETTTSSSTADDSKPSSTNLNSKETSKENASKDSTEKATSEGSTNKPTISSKTKSSRDKNAGSVTGGRVTSKSHNSGSESGGNAGGTSRKPAPNSQAGWAGNYILEPDPKFRNRAHAFAEGFLAKVKKQLSDDPVTYEEFLRTLALSSAEQCSPVELYRRVEVVLAQYPDLVEGFVGFLEPDQAVEAGVFMANLEFVRARTFLRKLEVHFQRSPSQFRKIINAFDSWNKKTMKDPLQLQQTIVPMLKGQMHLIEEFHSFFDDLKPPVCSDDDFEEIEFGSGSEPEVDDFEEVVIPCFVEPKKIKGRPAKDTLQKNSNTKKARKPGTTVKGTKQQGTSGKPLVNRTKVGRTKTNACGKDQTKAVGKRDNLQGKNQEDSAAKDMKPTPEGLANVETTGEECGVSDQRTEVNVLEGPLSVTTSLQSETSNDSYRGEELNPTNTDTLNLEHEEERERRHSDSEEQEDDGNSDMEHDGYEEDDDDDYMDGDDIDGDVIKSDVDAEASGCDSDANIVSSSAVVPAKNLQRSQDGQVVLLWTREDDRVILQACQKMGAKPETFEHIAKGLKNKTADEVKTRFMDLLNLFKASSGERTMESTNEESCSEEEDEDDSETVGESEGEHPHD